MTDDAKIIALFFERSEEAIRELDQAYGKLCQKLSCNIVNNQQDAEECVNDAYLGAWNTIPPAKPNPLRAYICRIVRNISLKLYHKKNAAKRSSVYETAMQELENCLSAPDTVETEIKAREHEGEAEDPVEYTIGTHFTFTLTLSSEFSRYQEGEQGALLVEALQKTFAGYLDFDEFILVVED